MDTKKSRYYWTQRTFHTHIDDSVKEHVFYYIMFINPALRIMKIFRSKLPMGTYADTNSFFTMMYTSDRTDYKIIKNIFTHQ